MLIFARIFTLLLFLLLPGCHEAGPEVADVNEPTVQKPTDVVSGIHQPTGPRITHDVAVFDIHGPEEALVNAQNFNRWATLPKTKGRVHLFANEEKTLKDLSGVKHVVLLNQLASKLGKTLTAVNPERIIIFLTGHGATSGNLCYESRHSCHLTPDILVDAFRGYAKGKDLLLRHVLVVPSSCYNKLLMDKFAELLKPEPFPFAITFISQKFDEECYVRSPAESLYENKIIPFRKLSDKQLDEFLKLATVEQLINFQNELVISHRPRYRSFLEFQVRYAPHPSSTNLSDFGFDVRVWQRLYFRRKDATGKPVNAKVFPNGLTVRELLDELELPARFQPRTQVLEFQMVENKPGGTPNVRKIIVNGDLSLAISEPDLKDKSVLMIEAILSQG